LFPVVGADAPQEFDVGSLQLAATGDDRIIELAEVVWDLRILPTPPDGDRTTPDDHVDLTRLGCRTIPCLLLV